MANIGTLAQQLKDRFEIPIGIREFDCRDRFASGLADIDRLLQGGFPRATLSEITGYDPESIRRLRREKFLAT